MVGALALLLWRRKMRAVSGKKCVATGGEKVPSTRLLTRFNPLPKSLPRTGWDYLNHYPGQVWESSVRYVFLFLAEVKNSQINV